MKMSELVLSLMQASEKGANIARTVRREQALFELLVEEKTAASKNVRFVQDFKTLADVLVQEVATHDICKKFPTLKANIRGEESNAFTNTLGESITVEMKDDADGTAELLSQVLNGNKSAAHLLAHVAHESVEMSLPDSLQDFSQDIDESRIGVWMDPIDSTAQYIEGGNMQRNGVDEACGGCLFSGGLQCALVLIGAFDLHTGQPLIGVVNQPFSTQDANKRWNGRLCWGVSEPSISAIPPLPSTNPVSTIVVSSSDDPIIRRKLSSHFRIQNVSGAGYKILCVIDDQASAYLLTKGSTFKWDTCGPHAMLSALGGGIVDYRKALDAVKHSETCSEEILSECQLRYAQPDDPNAGQNAMWANSTGLLAYKDPTVAMFILKQLR